MSISLQETKIEKVLTLSHVMYKLRANSDLSGIHCDLDDMVGHKEYYASESMMAHAAIMVAVLHVLSDVPERLGKEHSSALLEGAYHCIDVEVNAETLNVLTTDMDREIAEIGVERFLGRKTMFRRLHSVITSSLEDNMGDDDVLAFLDLTKEELFDIAASGIFSSKAATALIKVHDRL